MIFLSIFLQGVSTFPEHIKVNEKGNSAAITFMKADLEELYQTGQIADSERQEALRLLIKDSGRFYCSS